MRLHTSSLSKILITYFCYLNLIAFGKIQSLINFDEINEDVEDGFRELLGTGIEIIKLNPLFLDRITIADNIKFYCIKPQSIDFHQVYLNDSQNAISEKIALNKPLAILVHGWLDKFNSLWLHINGEGWMIRTSREWASFGDTNVCAVDWHPLAATVYSVAALRSTRVVSEYIGLFLERLHDLGISSEQITIAGHSLGGQIAGFVGAHLKSIDLYANKIYALDPARVLFTHPFRESVGNRLDSGDAQYVQAIHTSTVLGTYTSAGHADFYPNGGRQQKGCSTRFLYEGFPKTNTICNHFRAVEYFQLSLNPNYAFIGNTCEFDLKRVIRKIFVRSVCTPAVDKLGIYNDQVYGRFDLDTTDTVPFCENCV